VTAQNGFVVNDHEVLVELTEELVRLKEVLELQFGLLGKPDRDRK